MTTRKTAGRVIHCGRAARTVDAVSVRRNRSRLHHTPEGAPVDPRDYPLVDERGDRVGMIPAAVTRPVLGQHAPTYYLRKRVT